jgi:hypothetical protein
VAEYSALIIALLSFMTACVTLVTVLVGLGRGIKRDQRIENLTLSVDGRLTQLTALIAKSSHAEGVLEGVANEKAEQIVRDAPTEQSKA